MPKPDQWSRQVLRAIGKSSRSLREIATRADMELQVVCFYLGYLEDAGQVEMRYEIVEQPTPSTPGKARQVYSLVKKK